jgi:hypothetical protein
MRTLKLFGFLSIVTASASFCRAGTAKETWENGYPSAASACRAMIGQNDYVEFSRVDLKDGDGHCWTKPKDGKGEESYCCRVSKDLTPQPLKEDPVEANPSPAPADGPPADECAGLAAMSPKDLKAEVVSRLTKVMDAANDALAQNPAIAMQVVSEAEIQGMMQTFGIKTINKKLAMTESSLAVVYGHVIERLTARRFAQDDRCLPPYVAYIPNPAQLQTPGGSPDFKGLGKAAGLQIDITTEDQAAKKKAQGKKYEFIIYTRRLHMNDQGHAVP